MTNSAFNRWATALCVTVIVYAIGMMVFMGWGIGVGSMRRQAVKAGVGEFVFKDPSDPQSYIFVWKTNQSNLR